MSGECCSEILRHMQQGDQAVSSCVRPDIHTFDAVIDSYAYNGGVADAEDMLLSMFDRYESTMPDSGPLVLVLCNSYVLKVVQQDRGSHGSINAGERAVE